MSKDWREELSEENELAMREEEGTVMGSLQALEESVTRLQRIVDMPDIGFKNAPDIVGLLRGMK